MDRLAVEPDGAGAAIAGVAALLHAESSRLAQEGAQALAGMRRRGDGFAVMMKPAADLLLSFMLAPFTRARRGSVRRSRA